MSSSHPQIASRTFTASPEKTSRCFSAMPLFDGLSEQNPVIAGTMNDATMVRSVITDAMKNCGKSRIQIADEMTFLSGTTVTERMLNNFSAESKENRFPAELDRAFCASTGDTKLLTCRVQAFGLRVVSEAEWDLLELGRETLRLERAQKAAAALKVRLEGVVL